MSLMKHFNNTLCRFIFAAKLSLGSPFLAKAVDTLETSFESLESDLFQISLLTAQATDQLDAWEIQATVSHSNYDLEFKPVSFDFLGIETLIKTSTLSANLNASRELRDALNLDLGIGYRDGFTDYRSVWLDTYFDQHFSPLEGVPGHELYQNFEPSASSFSSGLSWEYIPANATATVSVSRIQDRVSPGYEIDFDGITRGELVLATNSLSLTTENVLTPRLRSRLALTASETSARDTRYSGEIALNAAIGDKVIWRNKIGASTEAPQFEAYFFDTTLEFATSDSNAVYFQARRYDDTGEIENALLFSTASPGLRNDSLAIGYRYTGDKWSASISATHSHSDFEETNINTDFFRNLYTDDDWLTLQFAVAKRF